MQNEYQTTKKVMIAFGHMMRFQALEAQLSSLQQPPYRYIGTVRLCTSSNGMRKEVVLAEINQSKEVAQVASYMKWKNLEVINEAIAFVGETVDDNNDLLLPPYPSRPSPALASDCGYLSHFTSTHKYPRDGLISNGQTSTDKNRMVHESRSPLRGIKLLLGAAAKATFTVVGVICILSLAGFEPRLRKRNNNQVNIWGLLPQQGDNSENKLTVECPAGRIPVIEDGEVRCLVKERVEVPFGSVVATPDVNYGCG
ncbi:hypothetical protein Leryth_023262 [Lithospermum erythrorhizon]|nr:hypothetical protein Leryth_023262 [Lithospermum erythrorhizon]